MLRAAIADTGPLVAYFDRREQHHPWAIAQFDALEPPLLVNEPILAGTLFLLRRHPAAIDALMNAAHSDYARRACNAIRPPSMRS